MWFDDMPERSANIDAVASCKFGFVELVVRAINGFIHGCGGAQHRDANAQCQIPESVS